MYIDCGANVRLISDIFLKLGASCYAFEPARDCIKILKHKFHKNNKFKLVPAAVSNRNGEEKFEYVKQLIEEDNIKNIYLDWI
jgi:FkbM family methyltransferase